MADQDQDVPPKSIEGLLIQEINPANGALSFRLLAGHDASQALDFANYAAKQIFKPVEVRLWISK